MTSRETLTVLLKEGYKIDVLSPRRFSIAYFSRLTHRVPIVDVNRFPVDYLRQVSQLLHKTNYKAILPTHEEGWLLANGKQFFASNRYQSPLLIKSSLRSWLEELLLLKLRIY